MRRIDRVSLAGLVAMAAVLLPGHARGANVVAGAVLGDGATPAGGMTGGSHAIIGTVGQSVVGREAGVTRDLCDGFWCEGGVRVTNVEDPPGAPAPATLDFGRPSPNPMRDHVALVLVLPRAAEVRVRVLDIAGRAVGEMHAGALHAGTYRLEWDGTDGVYFAALQIDGALVLTRRFVRLR
jgi:hypothetical protein